MLIPPRKECWLISLMHTRRDHPLHGRAGQLLVSSRPETPLAVEPTALDAIYPGRSTL
jgi:hypothetical protein